MTSPSHTITIPTSIPPVSVFGPADTFLRLIDDSFEATVHARGNEVTITGEQAEAALIDRLFDELVTIVRTGQPLTTETVERSISMLRTQSEIRPAEVLSLNILSNRGRTIRPKTLGQKKYVDAIDEHTVTFGIGPAGTGKTYLAMAKAVQALQAKDVTRIILTRPAVEAGESLGYLPGTLSEKIDPYLRPLYDALHDMLDPDTIPTLLTSGIIEVAPLAYMRGRAQPVDRGVMTPTGWRRIGSLRVGDLVIGSDGKPTPVLGVYPQGERDVYTVTAQDGASTIACGEHLWTVRTPEDRRRARSRTIQTKEMMGQERRGHARRFELPLVAPVQMESQDVPMDPYALGLLLGDGCITTSTTPTFTTADPELALELERLLPGIELTAKSGYDYVLRHSAGRRGLRLANPVTAVVRDLGLDHRTSSTKFVPVSYLVNSEDVRLAVLQGLLDSDGGPVTQQGRTCRIQYTSTSKRLRDDVVYLVRSLGGVAYSRTRKAAGRKPGRARGRDVGYRNDVYVIDIRLPAGIQPFRLKRKADKYHVAGGGRPMRFLDSIRPAGRAQTVCISVAAQDSLYVTDDFLVTHNTLNSAFVILDEAQNTTPEQMKMFLTRLGFGSKMVVTGDVTQVDLPGGTKSGLRVVRDILADVKDIHFSHLSSDDVVRHQLVGRIVAAYDHHDSQVRAQQAAHSSPRNGNRS